MGVLVRAVLFGVYIRTPDCWNSYMAMGSGMSRMASFRRVSLSCKEQVSFMIETLPGPYNTFGASMHAVSGCRSGADWAVLRRWDYQLRTKPKKKLEI